MHKIVQENILLKSNLRIIVLTGFTIVRNMMKNQIKPYCHWLTMLFVKTEEVNIKSVSGSIFVNS